MPGGSASPPLNMFLAGYAPPHCSFNRFHENEILAKLDQVRAAGSKSDLRCAALVLEFDKNKSRLQIGSPSGIRRLKLRQRPQFA
jgi:hypothetical protein